MEDPNKGRAEHTLVWTIENFKYAWHKKGEKFVSPVFVTDMLGNTSWTLELYPRGVEDDEYVDCFVRKIKASSGGYRFNYELLATLEGCSTSRVCGQPSQSDEILHLMKREVINRMTTCSHQNNLTLQCRIFIESYINYNFVGESFARTHILVEQISYTHCFDSDVEYESIMVRRMTGSKPLLIIRLRRMQRNDLIIELLPYDGYESIRYFNRKLILDDVRTMTRLHNHWTEECSQLESKSVIESLSRLDQLGEPRNRPLRLNLELTFSTGIERTQSERIVSSYMGDISSSI